MTKLNLVVVQVESEVANSWLFSEHLILINIAKLLAISIARLVPEMSVHISGHTYLLLIRPKYY